LEPTEKTVAEDEPYQEPKLLPKYKLVQPRFPFFKSKPVVLAVFSFSGKSSPITENDGNEFAEMLETELANHPNANETYHLFNRTQLEKLLSEKELSGEGDPKEIIRLGKLPSVDAIVTGHILTTTPDKMAVILKIINKKDASIIFTERFDGSLKEILDDMVSIFYVHNAFEGYDTVYTTKYKKVFKTKSVMKNVPYKDTETDWGRTIVSALAVVAVALILAFGVK
jgi:curli biogenesis system outer membrane secretion channel CsgG